MEIICDGCGAVLSQPEWKTLRDGDIEHTYFVCDSCGAAFSVSVTDGKLRQNIQKYKEMAKRLKERQCSESFQKRVQRLKAASPGSFAFAGIRKERRRSAYGKPNQGYHR